MKLFRDYAQYILDINWKRVPKTDIILNGLTDEQTDELMDVRTGGTSNVRRNLWWAHKKTAMPPLSYYFLFRISFLQDLIVLVSNEYQLHDIHICAV